MTLALDPVQVEPASRLVARTIEDKILAGEIALGDLQPSEAGLAERLGVNRSTSREAIRVLEQNGFVRREAGRKKLYASIPQSGDISRRRTAAMVLHQVRFEDLWEAMFAIEPAASAAHRSDEADLEGLERNLEDRRKAQKDSTSLAALDIAFHDLVARATRNRAIQMARLPISELFYPPFLKVMSRLNAGERLLVAHEAIFAAIRDHDEKRAREWMEKHILNFKRGYELANLDMATPVDMPEK